MTEKIKELAEYWGRILDRPAPPSGPQIVLPGDVVVSRDDLRLALAALAKASGMSAFGQDPQGLEAKPVSPTAKGGDAQAYEPDGSDAPIRDTPPPPRDGSAEPKRALDK